MTKRWSRARRQAWFHKKALKLGYVKSNKHVEVLLDWLSRNPNISEAFAGFEVQSMVSSKGLNFLLVRGEPPYGKLARQMYEQKSPFYEYLKRPYQAMGREVCSPIFAKRKKKSK